MCEVNRDVGKESHRYGERAGIEWHRLRQGAAGGKYMKRETRRNVIEIHGIACPAFHHEKGKRIPRERIFLHFDKKEKKIIC